MARAASLKNKFGRLTGANNVTVNHFGRDLEGITEVTYGDKFEDKVAYGLGDMPIGKESGNYEANASITYYMEEVMAIQSKLPPGSFLRDIPDFSIIVEYEMNGMMVKDVIEGCSYTGNSREIKSGDGKIMVKMDLLVISINWNAAA